MTGRNRTVNGLISTIYYSQRSNSSQRGHNAPNYSLKELFSWTRRQPEFSKLFTEWKVSGYEKKLTPSLDRTDDSLGYSLSRLKWMTWEMNYKKARSREVSVIQMTIGNKLLGVYVSEREAERETLVSQTSISKCCRGIRDTAGGFRWMKSLGIPIENNQTSVSHA